jgi:hypothetical protein
MIPPETMTGSYELRDLGHPAVGLLYEGKLTIDKTYGHASYGCGTCCGYYNTRLTPNPFNGPPSINNQDYYLAQEQCGGYWDDFTGSAYSWYSSNSAVATLPNSMLHTVAAGTATGSAQNLLQATHPAPRCPQAVMGGSQPVTVCPVPTSEVTSGAGVGGYPTWSVFNQTIGDTQGHSFDGKEVEEQSGGPGTNTCWWNGNPYGIERYPTVSGGTWTVAGGDVSGQHNHWGYDNIGFNNTALPGLIRQYGPPNGITMPCTYTMYQNMVIYCSASTNWEYGAGSLTVTVNASTSVTHCRKGICQTINGY